MIAVRFVHKSSSAQCSRVCFHPNFDRSQSESIGVTDLFISFTCLSDIMDLLGVRDEDDFEKILCTEINNNKDNLLQIMGSLKKQTLTNLGPTERGSYELRTSVTTMNSRNDIETKSTTIGTTDTPDSSTTDVISISIATSPPFTLSSHGS